MFAAGEAQEVGLYSARQGIVALNLATSHALQHGIVAERVEPQLHRGVDLQIEVIVSEDIDPEVAVDHVVAGAANAVRPRVGQG
ncbi:hypothetical protein D3C86_1553370 [compost metagenome]